MGQFRQIPTERNSNLGVSELALYPALKRSSSPPIALLVTLVIAALCVVAYCICHEFAVTRAIQRHGQRQDATVLQVYNRIFHHQKSGDQCDVFARYQINPRGWPSPLTRSIRLGSCNENIPAVAYIAQNHTLPIAYDTTNPDVARINFGDEVFREDAVRTLEARLLLLASFAAIAVCVVTVVISLWRS